MRNVYVVLRANQTFNSQPHWNSNAPQFRFSKTIDITPTEEFVQQLENNFLVIEVWDKYLVKFV